MSEFPEELIERCAKAASKASLLFPEGDRAEIVEAVLRESGHAKLVAALKAVKIVDVGGKPYIGTIAMSGCWSAEIPQEGKNIFAEWGEVRESALKKAGAL